MIYLINTVQITLAVDQKTSWINNTNKIYREINICTVHVMKHFIQGMPIGYGYVQRRWNRRGYL